MTVLERVRYWEDVGCLALSDMTASWLGELSVATGCGVRFWGGQGVYALSEDAGQELEVR